MLHDIAVGLHQLHQKGIFHQDVKPSNVLLFEAGLTAKVGDLGRAHCLELTAPHDDHRRPGAFFYAPPEQLYDFHVADRVPYRHGADLYLLGSMLDFFVTQTPTTVRLVEALADIHRPFTLDVKGWRGFYGDVLPFLQATHADLVSEFARKTRTLLPGVDESRELARDLALLFSYSTNPDPSARGHPGARSMRAQADYDLQRFISGFDILGKKIKIIEKYN